MIFVTSFVCQDSVMAVHKSPVNLSVHTKSYGDVQRSN